MPKYYASCGSQNLVIDTDSAEQAAMRLIDETLSAHIWIYEDNGLSEQDRRDHLVLEALLHLATDIKVSERGVGRCEAGAFGVPEMLDQWHKLMTVVASALSSAGLSSGRVLPKATPDPANSARNSARPPR